MNHCVRRKVDGFTMVETMIVLAITIALVGSSLALFQFRIPRTHFTNAVNDLEAKMRQINNDVATGFYPTNNNFTCTGGGVVGGTAEQGTNVDCIFLGKAIQFGSGDGTGCNPGSSAEKCDTIKVFTIYGRKSVNANQIATKLSEANPGLITIPQNIEEYKLGHGLHVRKVKVGTSPDNHNGVAYVQTFGSSTVSMGGSNEPQGSAQIQLIPLSGQLGLNTNPFSSQASSQLGSASPPINPAQGVAICLKSGTTNQHAIITLGESSTTNATKIEIFENSTGWSSRCA